MGLELMKGVGPSLPVYAAHFCPLPMDGVLWVVNLT